MLCREFGRTEQDILNTSKQFYEDSILILSKEHSKNLSNKR